MWRNRWKASRCDANWCDTFRVVTAIFSPFLLPYIQSFFPLFCTASSKGISMLILVRLLLIRVTICSFIVCEILVHCDICSLDSNNWGNLPQIIRARCRSRIYQVSGYFDNYNKNVNKSAASSKLLVRLHSCRHLSILE